MIVMNRRQFLFNVFDQFSESVSNKMRVDSRETDRVEWVKVGNLCDFPVGCIQSIQMGSEHITLHSDEDGIFAQQGLEWKPLKLQRGEIYLKKVGQWPEGTRLSVMTGEPVYSRVYKNESEAQKTVMEGVSDESGSKT